MILVKILLGFRGSLEVVWIAISAAARREKMG